MEWWVWLLIALGVVLLIGIIAFVVIQLTKPKPVPVPVPVEQQTVIFGRETPEQLEYLRREGLKPAVVASPEETAASRAVVDQYTAGMGRTLRERFAARAQIQ